MTRQASAKYYQKNKEKVEKKKSRKRYQNLSEEEKNKRQEYGHERYKNLSEDEKQKLVEYRKRYYEMLKITEMSLNKVFVSSCKSKNGVILQWSRTI